MKIFSRELLGDLSRGGGGEDQSLLCELLMGSDTREQCLAAAAAGDVKFFSKFPNHFITRHNIESRAAAAAAASCHHTHADSVGTRITNHKTALTFELSDGDHCLLSVVSAWCWVAHGLTPTIHCPDCHCPQCPHQCPPCPRCWRTLDTHWM